MSYVMITTWELADSADWDTNIRNVQAQRIPALHQLGATRVTVIRTSDRTAAAISEWPDAATRDAAMAMVEEVRKKVHSDGFRLTGEMKGTVVATS